MKKKKKRYYKFEKLCFMLAQFSDESLFVLHFISDILFSGLSCNLGQSTWAFPWKLENASTRDLAMYSWLEHDLACPWDPRDRCFGWKCHRAPHDLGATRLRVARSWYTTIAPTTAHLPSHTHTTMRHGKRLQINIEQTLETLRMLRKRSQSFVWKERAFSLEKNQVPTSLFHLFHSIDWDSVNTFLIHKHISVSGRMAMKMWKATSKIQSSLVVFPLVLQWRFFGKLGRERTRRS